MMSFIKQAITYTLITITLIFLLNILSAFILKLLPANGDVKPPYELPCFEDQDTAKGIHLEEITQLNAKYQSFTGWKMVPHQGKYFHIDEEGLRQHKHHVDPNLSQKSIAVFGGSTIWGSGNADHTTIPAYLDSLNHGFRVINFGEPAYNSRQELAHLINAYENGYRFDYVIFYDGVNDVLLCDKELTENDHALNIRYTKLIERYEAPESLALLFLKHVFIAKTLNLAESLHKKIFGGSRDAIVELYDCHKSPDKPKAIASHLIENWKIARDLVHSQGGEFIAILQPQLFTGSPNADYLGDVYEGNYLKEQYLAVYPEIEARIEKEQASWIEDYTNAFDGTEKIYYDFCHPVDKGNLIIANKLNRLLGQKELTKPHLPGASSEPESEIKNQ